MEIKVTDLLIEYLFPLLVDLIGCLFLLQKRLISLTLFQLVLFGNAIEEHFVFNFILICLASLEGKQFVLQCYHFHLQLVALLLVELQLRPEKGYHEYRLTNYYRAQLLGNSIIIKSRPDKDEFLAQLLEVLHVGVVRISLHDEIDLGEFHELCLLVFMPQVKKLV